MTFRDYFLPVQVGQYLCLKTKKERLVAFDKIVTMVEPITLFIFRQKR